jgi:hypothetical protein
MSEDEFPPARGVGLDDEHQLWITERSASGRALVARYTRGKSKADLPTLAALDETYEAWRAAPPAERAPVRDIVEGLGALLGAHLVAIEGLEWIVVKDDESADLAVYGSAAEMLVYPIMYVRTHHENEQPLDAEAMVRDVKRRWQDLNEELTGDL